MFSDKFIEINNYSLFKKEYLNTSSIMPWRYTSVYDNTYKPELSEEIKNKFQLFFYYRLQYTAQILEDDRKYLDIIHKDGIIEEFRAINPLNLAFFIDSGEWNHFIHSLEISGLDLCRQKMFDYAKESIIVSGISSVTYDSNCCATGIYFHNDPNIMLNHSEMADKLCEVSCLVGNNISTVHITPNDNKIRYNIALRYDSRTFGFRKITKKSIFDSSNFVPMVVKFQPQTDKMVNSLRENDLLTDEMVEYIKQVVPNETKVEFEFILEEDGTLTDIILRNIIIEEFHNVAEEQNLALYDVIDYERKTFNL